MQYILKILGWEHWESTRVSGYAYIPILINVSVGAEIYLKYPALEIKIVRTGTHAVPHAVLYMIIGNICR